MELIPVKSSAILKVGYAESNLFIEFVGGEWYKYADVPITVFEQLLRAPSKGTFVNQRIKPYYHGEPCLNPEL